jgi:selenocysteine lyase/cysteine desulfurase
VTVGPSLTAEHDGTSDTAMADLHAFLSARGVRLGIRRGLLRFSFHIYNNTADIDAVAGLARAFLGSPAAARLAKR